MTAFTLASPRTRSPQWVRTAKTLGRSYATMLVLWFWAIALPAVAVVLFIISRSEEIQASGVTFTHQGAMWFPFGIAITMVVAYLPLHVANGMTRRSFVIAAVVTNVFVGLANAAISVVALLVERGIYDSLGLFHGSIDGQGLEVLHGGALNYGLGLTMIFTGAQLSGLLVGIVYYRTGGWVGTFLLPLTLLPLAVVVLVGLDPASQWVPWGGANLHSSWGTALAVLTLLAATGVVYPLTRTAPIASKKA